MAVTPVRSSPVINIEKVLWETLTAAEATGTAIIPMGYGPSSVQVTGTFGGTVTFAGSNDGTNFVTLEDNAGNAMSTTAAALWDFTPSTLYIRPAAGAGVSDVDVTLIMKPEY